MNRFGRAALALRGAAAAPILGMLVPLFTAAVLVCSPAAYAQNAAKDCESSSDELRTIRACTEVIRRSPRNVDAYRRRASAYYVLDLMDKAIADYSKIIEIEPRNADAYSRRGDWFSEHGDYEKAIADLARALALNFNASTLRDRAYAYYRKGEFARAQADATRLISMEPKEESGYSLRGRALLAMKSYKEAIADLQRAIELDPQDSAFEKAIVQLAEVGAARAAGTPFSSELARTLCKQTYDSVIAIDACTMLIDGGTRDHVISFQRGLAYQDSGDQPRAIADFTAAIELNPNAVPAYYQRANSNQKIGNLEPAIADLTKAVERSPDDIDIRWLRADLYRRHGDYQRAIEDYEILKRDRDMLAAATIRIEDAQAALAAQPRPKPTPVPAPAAPPTKSAAAKGSAPPSAPPAAGPAGDCSHASQPDLAVVACGTVIQQNPQNVAALLVRAAAYHDKKAYDRAIADYTSAIKLQPRNAVIYNERGYAHFESRAFDQAISDFSAAIEIDAQYARAYLNRGLAYSAGRAYLLAGRDFAEAVKRQPASAASIQPYVDEVNAKLSEASSAGAAPDRDACLTQVPLQTKSKYIYPARIEACSRAIGSGQFKSKELASLFESRGYAHSLTNDRRNAVSDWDRLFELDPAADVDILFSRARLRMELKDHEGTIRDLRQFLQSTGRIPESERTMLQNQNRITATATLKLLGGNP